MLKNVFKRWLTFFQSSLILFLRLYIHKYKYRMEKYVYRRRRSSHFIMFEQNMNRFYFPFDFEGVFNSLTHDNKYGTQVGLCAFFLLSKLHTAYMHNQTNFMLHSSLFYFLTPSLCLYQCAATTHNMGLGKF